MSNSDFSKTGEVAHYLAESGDDEVVGRISVHVHPERAYGGIGLFECVPDSNTARHLLGAAEDWLRSRGRQRAIGPVDPSPVTSGGVLLSGDGPTTEQMSYNGAWHADLLLENGWRTYGVFQTWNFHSQIPKQVQQISNAVGQKKGLKVVRLCQLKNVDTLDLLTEIYNKSYKGTLGYVHTSARDLGDWLGYPDRVDHTTSMVAFFDGKPAAFAVTLPERTALSDSDWSLRQTVNRLISERLFRPDSLRLALFGVVPEFRGSAVGGLSLHLYVRLIQAMGERGISSGILTWTQKNDEVTAEGLSLVGAQIRHRYGIFEKSL